ncbi:VirB3 family type IV secretion system protein [Paremcibacter congregatus]|uniref:VirB3 family type IV secretion system protein n=1 Tax=Paremcibacter congregatus TaxID=2043170 RepID=UPI003A93ED5E
MAETGFLTPVYDALIDRHLLAGLPRAFAIMIWMSFGALALFQGAWFMLIVGGILHYVGAFFVGKDPYFFEILKLSRQYPEYYP